MKLFVKGVRAHQLYLHNNPIYLRAIELLGEGFGAVWQHADELSLTFTESEIRFHNHAVLTEPAKSADSLPWLFFKDGIREVRITRGFEEEELARLLDVVQRARKATPDDDDLLTMLWEQDFLYLRYRFVDLAMESAPPLLDTTPAELRPNAEAAPEQIQESVVSDTRPGVVSLDDFDTTLYFLDDKEIDYLREGVKNEYSRDLRPSVLSLLLDNFEAPWDGAIRDEICEILDGFILHLLSAAAARMACQNTSDLVKLNASPNELVSGEAIRRAGGLKTAAAVAPLAAIMTDGAQPLRLLAVQALNEIASPGALQVLEKSSDDPDREVRVATLRAIAARSYKPALPRLDSAVKGKRSREVDLTEKMALFEAFGALAGDAGIAVLDGMLTGKGFLGKREDPELRACAAMALGRIGGPRANEVLRKASTDNEKEVLVRNAINRALRAPSA
jgi:hypothetical protein